MEHVYRSMRAVKGNLATPLAKGVGNWQVLVQRALAALKGTDECGGDI